MSMSSFFCLHFLFCIFRLSTFSIQIYIHNSSRVMATTAGIFCWNVSIVLSFSIIISIQPSREYHNSRSKRFLVCTAYAVGLYAPFMELETVIEINVSFLPAEGAPAAVHWLWPVSFPSRPTRRHPPRHSGHAESWDCITTKQQPKNMGDKSIGISTFLLFSMDTNTHAALVAQCWTTAW